MDLHRLGEERSIALHSRIAELLRENPGLRAAAQARVEEWSRTGLVAGPYVSAWRALLALPLDDLCRALVDPGANARALRQVTPFAGALDARERWRIRREVARQSGESA